MSALLAGRWGWLLKKKRLAKLVVGVVRKKSTLQKAFKRKALDVATLNLEEGVRGADLVILCAPISDIVDHIRRIGRFLGPKTIVMDVGSSKEQILNAAKKHLKKNIFVGCHPMAGSERCGIEFAKVDLFHGAVCFVSSPNKKVAAFWRALGAKPIRVDARRHDAWVAKVSHLPHVLSFSLLQDIRHSFGPKFPLNPSFKDLSRLARSHPGIWSDILLSNQKELLTALKYFQSNVRLFEKALQAKDRNKIARLIAAANANAERLVPNEA